MPSFPPILRSSSRNTVKCSSFSLKLLLPVNRRTFYSFGVLAASVAVGIRHGKPAMPQRIISGIHRIYNYPTKHFVPLRGFASFVSSGLFLSPPPDMTHISTLNLL